jgi:hypothetical protein
MAPYPEIPDGIHKTEHIHKPNHNNDNHNGIQDRFDRTCHWDKRVHEPQKNPDNNQRKSHLKQRHNY